MRCLPGSKVFFMIRRLALKVAYHSGFLGAWHRRRNGRALTVLSLHRVLPESDPRWAGADPLYTVSSRFFEQLLGWIVRHYSVVSLDDVLAASEGTLRLPPCPLLITFDDGWADNYAHALPLLRKFALPAVLFCAADAIDRHEGFYQERLVSAWLRGRLANDVLQSLWRDAGVPSGEVPADATLPESVRSLVARLQAIEPGKRARLLEPLAADLHEESRQMLTAAELRSLAAAGVGIGTHGRQHEPLTRVANLPAELRDARRMVAQSAGMQEDRVVTLSFPFSKQDAGVVREAHAAGYVLLFGGGLTLAPVLPRVPRLVPRVGITAGPVQDAGGNLRPDMLAAYLFRRPIAVLQPG